MKRIHKDLAAARQASKAQQAQAKRENAAHTPGPWVAVGCQVEVLSDSIPDICNANPETFGQHGRSDNERCANARLIAAAPDMLQVLQELEESSEYWSEYFVPLGIVERINAAIKKATGETP